jgi:hypothetical protein
MIDWLGVCPQFAFPGDFYLEPEYIFGQGKVSIIQMLK